MPAIALGPFAAPMAAAQVHYAGFGARAAAAIIDFIILNIISSMISAVFVGLLLTELNTTTILIGTIAPVLVDALITLFYSVWLESSTWQATIGKKLVGLKVVDLEGRRISFGRSCSRSLGKSLSALILGIGYLMPLWDTRRQALHDKMAGCLVVRL